MSKLLIQQHNSTTAQQHNSTTAQQSSLNKFLLFCLITLFSVQNCSKKKPNGISPLALLALAGGGGSSSSSASSSGGNNKTSSVNPTAKSKEALITAFSIKGKYKGTITNQNIEVKVPYATDVTALKATAKISDGASISPAPSKQTNYTDPVNFTVTAEDGTSKKVYKVTVTVKRPILSWTGGWRNDDAFTATITNKTITIDVDSADFMTKVILSDGVTINPDPDSSAIDWTNVVTFTAKKGSKSETYQVKVTVDGKNIIKVNDGNIKTTITTEIGKYGNTANYNYIDVSAVTSMSSLFQDKRNFNGDITKWDTSGVTLMNKIFLRALVFNQKIGSWNVSEVTNMSRMFEEARNFNEDISSWDVSKVQKMDSMFVNARNFNKNISSWDVEQVTVCSFFSGGASAFQLVNKPHSTNKFTNCDPNYNSR